ncbi:hypothetical protein NIES2119_15655 [[Phormidium ambiguum] IAM M-71]|uniref:Uncharacterized protein n=1 Tax=[Phormidium ambiguum] IAM M-71 TaxID=454136 RepID=A0A1U7IIB6_9CYAN|nr:hypothetical protein [Phormidium ambiguum]OKH36855.1 hypothetical protein NIES2119_15655 [Phormidium ambiguum IAM M-71]
MLHFHQLCEFSRFNCVAICAFLVPANLLATLQTMILVGLNRPLVQLVPAITMAIMLAILMILHVFTWFMIGVVMLPTYILLSLGSLCLTINLWAVLNRTNMRQLLREVWLLASRVLVG